MKKSILNTSIKACNSYGLTLNAIWIFSSLLYILWFSKKDEGFIKLKGKILNIEENNICKINDNDFSLLNYISGNKNHCILEIEYFINDIKKINKIDFHKCDNLSIGQNIDILYNENKNEIIIDYYNQLLKKVLYFVIFFMSIILIFTFLRIFYSDNKWMKIYIGLQCFLPG